MRKKNLVKIIKAAGNKIYEEYAEAEKLKSELKPKKTKR
jgi:hypothetical protein